VAIRLLLADVDGTLVTHEKILTDRTIAVVKQLKQADILFAITSGRPPRGMSVLIEPLELTTPIAAFNGGMLVNPDMSVIEQRTIPDDVTPEAIDVLGSHGMDVWVYRGSHWYLRDPEAPHVARESSTVRFHPRVVESLTPVSDGVAKLVGVSDDHEAVLKAVDAVRDRFGDHVSAARSQPYYADVTHPRANKGAVVSYLSKTYQVPTEEIATIGDQSNDVLMFAHSGLSIAMGNASHEVQEAARRVTTSCSNEGFANAVERFILAGPGAGQAPNIPR